MGAKAESLMPESAGRKRNLENFRLLTGLNSLNIGNDSHSVSRYSKIRRPCKTSSRQARFPEAEP